MDAPVDERLFVKMFVEASGPFEVTVGSCHLCAADEERPQMAAGYRAADTEDHLPTKFEVGGIDEPGWSAYRPTGKEHEE